ncbi:hypothetical protein CLOM_g10044 [Closterium sp. NIES-68]|nr:hypothetical protein CLOM_g10044 [Closterium sp. NIES-68]
MVTVKHKEAVHRVTSDHSPNLHQTSHSQTSHSQTSHSQTSHSQTSHHSHLIPPSHPHHSSLTHHSPLYQPSPLQHAPQQALAAHPADADPSPHSALQSTPKSPLSARHRRRQHSAPHSGPDALLSTGRLLLLLAILIAFVFLYSELEARIDLDDDPLGEEKSFRRENGNRDGNGNGNGNGGVRGSGRWGLAEGSEEQWQQRGVADFADQSVSDLLSAVMEEGRKGGGDNGDVNSEDGDAAQARVTDRWSEGSDKRSDKRSETGSYKQIFGVGTSLEERRRLLLLERDHRGVLAVSHHKHTGLHGDASSSGASNSSSSSSGNGRGSGGGGGGGGSGGGRSGSSSRGGARADSGGGEEEEEEGEVFDMYEASLDEQVAQDITIVISAKHTFSSAASHLDAVLQNTPPPPSCTS